MGPERRLRDLPGEQVMSRAQPSFRALEPKAELPDSSYRAFSRNSYSVGAIEPIDIHDRDEVGSRCNKNQRSSESRVS
jgi:hypothetical protein